MFRSSLSAFVGGAGVGLAVAAEPASQHDLRAAVFALLTALTIAVTDWLVRRSQERRRREAEREHEERFLREHAKTRRAISKRRRTKPR